MYVALRDLNTMADKNSALKRLQRKVLEHMKDGLSLRQICKLKKMPAQLTTIHNWALKDKEFAEQYAVAKQIQAERDAEEARDFARSLLADAVNGRERSREYIQAAKLYLDTIKWSTCFNKPAKFSSAGCAAAIVKETANIQTREKIEVYWYDDIKNNEDYSGENVYDSQSTH